eukprot:COSAG06_NODE_4474_length_4217_cov_11.624089_2_plen_479_part_00
MELQLVTEGVHPNKRWLLQTIAAWIAALACHVAPWLICTDPSFPADGWPTSDVRYWAGFAAALLVLNTFATYDNDEAGGSEPSTVRVPTMLFQAKVFAKFASLPRHAVLLLAFLAAPGMNIICYAIRGEDEVSLIKLYAELKSDETDWPLIFEQYGSQMMYISASFAVMDLHAAMQPRVGTLAVLSKMEDGVDLRISTQDLRSVIRWFHLCANVALSDIVWSASFAVMDVIRTITFHVPAIAYLVLFKLAATLARTKVDRLSDSLADLVSMETCTDENWESMVRQPAIELAQTTLPALTKMGPTIGIMFFQQIFQMPFHLPQMLTHVPGWSGPIIHTLVWMAQDWVGAREPAAVSSRCSAFIDQLNDLRCLGRTDSMHSRVLPLECFLKNKNRGQGIGFCLFSVKIDKRLLMQVAIGLASCASTLITWRGTLEEEFLLEEELEEMCEMTAEQVAIIQSVAGLMNASCTYALKVGPGGA